MKKYIVRSVFRKAWISIPERKQEFIISFFQKNKWIPKSERVAEALLRRAGWREAKEYARFLLDNFDAEVERIKKAPIFIKINRSNDGFFHTHIISDVVEYTVAAMRIGAIPVFYYNGFIDTPDHVCLEWFFCQPFASVFGFDNKIIDSLEFSDRDIVNIPFRIESEYLWATDSEELSIWRGLAQKIIQKNDFFEQYNHDDMVTNGIIPKDLLGVIIRGTDYVKLKPKLHPVQPEMDEIIAKVKEALDSSKYVGIYVATDEERVFKKVVDIFGNDKVFTNSREYYDEIYRENNLWQIKDAVKSRDNDRFLNSLEYISSIFILSECNGIIGGLCSGSTLATLFSNNSDFYFFNKGYY